MIYKSRSFILPCNEEIILRSPTSLDADKLIRLEEKTVSETDFLTRSPGEDVKSAEKQIKLIERINTSENMLMILSEMGERLAGSCTLQTSKRKKTAHRGTLGITILRKFWSMGIGTLMIEETAAYAKKIGITQLELLVMETNTRAIRLYEHLGFVKVGELPNAYRLENGEYRSQLMMIRPL